MNEGIDPALAFPLGAALMFVWALICSRQRRRL
jgi:hypothetical protein